MKILSAEQVAAASPYRDIVEALRQGFRNPAETPVRHHHDPAGNITLLLMPAWTKQWTGIKTVVFKPDNPALGLPTIQATYQLIDNATGTTVAMLDGTELTRRRTAAASALAADYLARRDAAVHTIVGAGALAVHFAKAHASVRTIAQTLICNRSRDKAETVVKELRADGMNAEVCDLETALRAADIVSGITSSTTPLIKGAWLQPGTHIDLAGAFKPTMCEADPEAVSMASVYVDTHEGALAEAGDLLQARDAGKFDFANVKGDLAALCQGKLKGRVNASEITLFKSCGTALEDLTTAVMVYLRAGQ